ncbi:MAG: hypothetical protein R3327_04670 [Nitrosopumilaceae archaeon]|nr:hypothetical protein [Nitrosopumilaceae archaeon]
MEIDLPVNLLKLVKQGSLVVSENNKQSVKISFNNNSVLIDLLEMKFNIPTNTGIFTRLSEAREFAKLLKKRHYTLCISHKGKTVIKLGKDAQPKLSRLITRSDAVEISNLRELRKLDKRLRLK